MGVKEATLFKAASPAMRMLNEWTKDIKPENPFAQFIEDHFVDLFKSQNLGNDNMASGLLAKMLIDEANRSPDWMEYKLTSFYEAFRVFYTEYKSCLPEYEK